MAAQGKIILDPEGGDGIRGAVIILTGPAAVHILPLHVVLGDDEPDLLQNKIDKLVICADLRRRNRRPVNQPLFRGQLPQRHSLGRARPRRRHQADAATEYCKTSSENATSVRMVSLVSGADHLSSDEVLR